MAEEIKNKSELSWHPTPTGQTDGSLSVAVAIQAANVQGQQSPKDDTEGLRRIADEKRNEDRREQAKELKAHLVTELTDVQRKWPPIGFISRAGDLLIYISYPANIVAKISLPNPRRSTPMVIVYDQAFRRIIKDSNSNFLKDFIIRYVV